MEQTLDAGLVHEMSPPVAGFCGNVGCAESIGYPCDPAVIDGWGGSVQAVADSETVSGPIHAADA